MAIKRWKKAETIFARQILAAANTGIRHGEAARFSPALTLRLIDSDLKPSLNEFMRGTQTAYTSAENRNSTSHDGPLIYHRRPARLKRYFAV
jgi:hypothetical protein